MGRARRDCTALVAHDALDSPQTMSELRRNDALVAVGSQIFALPAHPLRHPDRCTASDELMIAVSHGWTVSGATIGSHIKIAQRGAMAARLSA